MKKFYAQTTPYAGLWVGSNGKLLGEILRFTSKAARDAALDAHTRAITASMAKGVGYWRSYPFGSEQSDCEILSTY